MQNVKNTMLLWVLRGLAPHPCISCGALGAVLCARCKYDIIHAWIDRCVVCCRPKGCAHSAHHWVSYVDERSDSVRQLLNDFKFRYRVDTACIAAELMAPLLRANEVLVSIPTIRAHIRQRGFDHNRSLVEALSRQNGLKTAHPLRRTDTVVMHTLNKAERLKAAKKLFSCPAPCNPTTQYVLIDDVYTTGATLFAARAALLKAGAIHVRGVVLARQPLD